MKIAHISDLHLSPEYRRSNIASTKRLLDHIGTLDVDHLVITGDIAANAEKRDFQLARSILKSSGWLASKSLSLVIGNHDIFGGVHHAEDIFTFPKRCKQTDYKGKVLQFYDYFHEAFDKCLHGSESSVFPYGKVIGDVVLVGMNSIAEYSKLGNPIGSNGEINQDAFKKTKHMLSSPLLSRKRKLVLIHHHFYRQASGSSGALPSLWNSIEGQTMKLRRKKKLLEMFSAAKVELVLHGHLHENREYERKGIRCVNGGGSILLSKEEARLNMITIDHDTIRVETTIVANGAPKVIPALLEVAREGTHAAA